LLSFERTASNVVGITAVIEAGRLEKVTAEHEGSYLRAGAATNPNVAGRPRKRLRGIP